MTKRPKEQSYEHHPHHPKLTYVANVFMLATLVCIVAGWMGRDTTYGSRFGRLRAGRITVLTGRPPASLATNLTSAPGSLPSTSKGPMASSGVIPSKRRKAIFMKPVFVP